MNEKNIKQSELAEAVGIPKTTLSSMILRDNTKIEIEKFLKICDYLDCDPDEFYKEFRRIKTCTMPPSFTEKYYSLDTYGKNAVQSILNIEYDRCTCNQENSEAKFLSQEIEKFKQETEQTTIAYYEKMLELEVNKAKEETKQALEAEYQEKLKKVSLSSTDETNNIENMKDEEKQIKDTDKTETFNSDFTFANNGEPYHFGNQKCGDGGQFITIDYSCPGCLFDLRSIELTTKDKKIILKLGYQCFSSIESTDYREISVLPEELDSAKQIVTYLNKLIIENEEKHKKHTAEIDGAEEVRLIDVDGSVRNLSVGLLIDDDNLCLIGDGNNDYHKHLSCFSNWNLAERKQFKEWTVISIEEAKKQGRKYCKFCAKDDKMNKKFWEDIKAGKLDYLDDD